MSQQYHDTPKDHGELELTTSTTAKKIILKKYPESKLFWKLCYNSFWTYGIRDIPEVNGNVEGKIGTIHTCIKRLLGDLHNRRYTGNEALHKVHMVMEKSDLYTRDLLTRILLRDARCGVNVKLINAVWPGLVPTHDVMLAQKIDWNKLQYPCVASIKLDGVRAQVSKDGILTRAGKRLVGLEHLQEQVPKDIILDGELMVPNMNFHKGCGHIRSYDLCPTAVLHTFEIPNSKDNFFARLERIAEIAEYCEHIVPVYFDICENEEEVRACFQSAIRHGYEGLVVKPMNYYYERKRSKHWMKIKDMQSYDLRVIGKFEGEGKYEGAMGGIVVNFKGVKVRVGTGFSDYEREKYWKEDIAGNIAEVECHEITPDGSMRHPRFKGFRWDKNEISHD